MNLKHVQWILDWCNDFSGSGKYKVKTDEDEMLCLLHRWVTYRCVISMVLSGLAACPHCFDIPTSTARGTACQGRGGDNCVGAMSPRLGQKLQQSHSAVAQSRQNGKAMALDKTPRCYLTAANSCRLAFSESFFLFLDCQELTAKMLFSFKCFSGPWCLQVMCESRGANVLVNVDFCAL